MEKQKIVDNLVDFGDFFSQVLEGQNADPLVRRGIELIPSVSQFNPWFTEDFVRQSFKAWADSLKKEKIEKWLENYQLQNTTPHKVGVIMAGNIPMVGLHDALSVLISGNILMSKLSSKDKQLIELCLEVLATIDKDWKERIQLTDRLNNIDKLIATGSDNSARYFEYYFREIPKVIRKNRSSIAVLSERVEQEELNALASDVFTYFGLGCRNVTKIFIPTDFDLDRIFEAFFPYKDLINHHQYANNYDYNKAVYLMNKIELVENGFLLLKEDEGIHSPLGVLFYERYNHIKEVEDKLISNAEQIQAVVSDLDNYLDLGKAQSPELWDYADNLDTISFLLKRNSV